MKKEMICICCPIGCAMTVEKLGEEFEVFGNGCPRGKSYALSEMTAPKRMVTASVPVTGGDCPMASVKTSAAIPKELIFSALDRLKGVVLAAPVNEGDVVVKNVCGSGADFVATRSVAKAE